MNNQLFRMCSVLFFIFCYYSKGSAGEVVATAGEEKIENSQKSTKGKKIKKENKVKVQPKVIYGRKEFLVSELEQVGLDRVVETCGWASNDDEYGDQTSDVENECNSIAPFKTVEVDPQNPKRSRTNVHYCYFTPEEECRSRDDCNGIINRRGFTVGRCAPKLFKFNKEEGIYSLNKMRK